MIYTDRERGEETKRDIDEKIIMNVVTIMEPLFSIFVRFMRSFLSPMFVVVYDTVQELVAP